MNTILWAIGLATSLVGLLWLVFNRMNHTMLRAETLGVIKALDSEADESMRAYRSMQFTDAYLAEVKNDRNFKVSFVILAVGSIWLLGMVLWSFLS